MSGAASREKISFKAGPIDLIKACYDQAEILPGKDLGRVSSFGASRGGFREVPNYAHPYTRQGPKVLKSVLKSSSRMRAVSQWFFLINQASKPASSKHARKPLFPCEWFCLPSLAENPLVWLGLSFFLWFL